MFMHKLVYRSFLVSLFLGIMVTGVESSEQPQLQVSFHPTKLIVGSTNNLVVEVRTQPGGYTVGNPIKDAHVRLWEYGEYGGGPIRECYTNNLGKCTLENIDVSKSGLYELRIDHDDKYFYCNIAAQDGVADLIIPDHELEANQTEFLGDAGKLPSWDANRNGSFDYGGKDVWWCNSHFITVSGDPIGCHPRKLSFIAGVYNISEFPALNTRVYFGVIDPVIYDRFLLTGVWDDWLGPNFLDRDPYDEWLTKEDGLVHSIESSKCDIWLDDFAIVAKVVSDPGGEDKPLHTGTDIDTAFVALDNNYAVTGMPKPAWCSVPDESMVAHPYDNSWIFQVINPLAPKADGDIIIYASSYFNGEPQTSFVIAPYPVPDPDFEQIDDSTYVYRNVAAGEFRSLRIDISSAACDPSGGVNVVSVIDSTLIGSMSFPLERSTCPRIKIEKVHNTPQGRFEEVSITTKGGINDFGGFDFLIAYDASALAFTEANPGQLLEDCGWEHFTYRYGVQGNCGDACPTGLLRIIAIAETNNGPYHPSCLGPTDCDEYELARMQFYITNDRLFNCQFVPIGFFWDDCADNSLSSPDGEYLYVERAVYNFDNSLIWNEEDDAQFPEESRLPFIGVSDDCLDFDSAKSCICRCPIFVNGGIDIVCSDSIDVRGDINCNGVAYEIADAVMLTDYFISGLSAFGDHVEASIAASDVNADGISVSVADLVCLIRVITGDAQPYPKTVPQWGEISVGLQVNHSAAAVAVESAVDIGGGYFELDHTGYDIGEPHLINGASDMTLKYGDENGILKLLVYSMEKDRRISAGTEHIFAVPVSGEGTITLRKVELSDYLGNPLTTRIDNSLVLPATYAVHQNYPNPFNATTTIMYELPVNTHVKIDVFNTLGQKVATLIDREEEAGIHSVAWDGADQSGTTVASGVYVYRISTPEYTAEKKIIVMK